jgi:hypothetical protein
MAEASAQGGMPTFKLVLVGDGGTGKVCKSSVPGLVTAGSTPHKQGRPALAIAP